MQSSCRKRPLLPAIKRCVAPGNRQVFTRDVQRRRISSALLDDEKVQKSRRGFRFCSELILRRALCWFLLSLFLLVVVRWSPWRIPPALLSTYSIPGATRSSFSMSLLLFCCAALSFSCVSWLIHCLILIVRFCVIFFFFFLLIVGSCATSWKSSLHRMSLIGNRPSICSILTMLLQFLVKG